VTVSEVRPSSVLTVLSTAPDAEIAERIGTVLVEEGLAACANILDGVTSIYRWKGSVEREREALMVFKTTSETVERLRLRLVELHPYDVPEVVALGVQDGHEPYLDWVRSVVGPDV
jgi:periplasmic divalent cation tolerance protein